MCKRTLHSAKETLLYVFGRLKGQSISLKVLNVVEREDQMENGAQHCATAAQCALTFGRTSPEEGKSEIVARAETHSSHQPPRPHPALIFEADLEFFSGLSIHSRKSRLPLSISSCSSINMSEWFPHFRILIIGRANSGKTTILRTICGSEQNPVVYRSGKVSLQH